MKMDDAFVGLLQAQGMDARPEPAAAPAPTQQRIPLDQISVVAKEHAPEPPTEVRVIRSAVGNILLDVGADKRIAELITKIPWGDRTYIPSITPFGIAGE